MRICNNKTGASGRGIDIHQLNQHIVIHRHGQSEEGKIEIEDEGLIRLNTIECCTNAIVEYETIC